MDAGSSMDGIMQLNSCVDEHHSQQGPRAAACRHVMKQLPWARSDKVVRTLPETPCCATYMNVYVHSVYA